jgi:hypothetical protein
MKKKPVKADPDLAEWCRVLGAPAICADPVPPGWATIAELSEKMSKSIPQVSVLMRRALKRGEVEKKKFRIVTGRGPFPVPHYKRVK